jgi:hypothetical protein
MSKVKTATYVTLTVDGESKSFSESAFNKQVEEATKSNTAPPTPLKRQTFLMHEAEVVSDGIEDILSVCPNAQVAVDLFNRGASLKQLNEIRDLMEDDTFEVVEGSYDLKDTIARVTERKKLSPMDKVLRSLGQLSDEERQAIVAKLLATQAATA